MSEGTDEYTSTPTHIRVFEDAGEWFVDGADNDLRYTEACWSYDTFDEALAAIPEFVAEASSEWRWDSQRPHPSRHLSAHTTLTHAGCAPR